jgi:transcriptional regulator GlxA family with amidase domain
LQWLLAQRVLLARRLLEATDEPVARVAARAGFGDALSLRQHFARATATTPLAYRRTFRGRAALDG